MSKMAQVRADHCAALLARVYEFIVFIYLLVICKYTVAVFRHSRRGRQISLQMVVSYIVVVGFELRTFRRAVSALTH